MHSHSHSRSRSHSRLSNHAIAFLVPAVLAIILTVTLSGCSSNTANSPQTAALQVATIQALTGEGCLQLAKSHPDRVSSGMADLDAARSALDSGKLTYGDILGLALNHVKIDPQAMVVVQPAIDAISAQLGANGKSVIPVRGSNAYNVIQAGVIGCRAGLAVASQR